MTKLDWLQGVTISDVTKTRVEWYGKAGNNYIGTESCTEPKIVLNDFETP